MTPEEVENLNLMATMLTSINNRLATLEQSNTELNTANAALSQLLATATSTATATAAAASETTVHAYSSHEPKIAPPTPFGGVAADLRPFLVQVELMFNVNSSRFTTEISKIYTVASYLTGKALAWMTPMLENPEIHQDRLKSWPLFKAALKATFGPVDQAATSANAIRNLKQGNRRVVDYAAEFQLLASDIDFNEPALMHLFKHGLADEIKTMLLNVDEPTTILDFIKISTRADLRLLEHRRDKAYSSKLYLAPPGLPAAPAAPAARSSDAMELDAIVRRPPGPLTAAERAHRTAKGLCMFCGAAGHLVPDCPLVKAKNRASVAAVSLKAAVPAEVVPEARALDFAIGQ
jgi:hypothetical protein